MKKNLEKITESCPFMNMCAIEYGQADVCKDENYKDCSIYQDYIKYKKKNEKEFNDC